MPKTTQPPQLKNPFQPFGDSIRIAASSIHRGNVSICANLNDLCVKHQVEYRKAIKLEYPNGSVAMIQLDEGNLAHEVYLHESAYFVFIACIQAGELS